jgi:transposase InsO family protein
MPTNTCKKVTQLTLQHMPNVRKRTQTPPLEIRLSVLSAVDYAPGDSIKARIVAVSKRVFTDSRTGIDYQFTWRTISTWLYRYKVNGVATLETKTRADKHRYRSVQPNELAEAINDILPTLGRSKNGTLPKMALYRALIKREYVKASQLSQTSFYRMVRDNNLLDNTANEKMRSSFAMQHANEMWQADTMHGPYVHDANGNMKPTFLIAFIDDASRLITHGEFFFADNTVNMCDAFRSALFKRGKPERLYFDNGSNYTSNEILQACVRLDIKLSHAPVRDGAAKGKIERFFRGFRDRFLIEHTFFSCLSELNVLAQQWMENDYNQRVHSAIQMTPLDRFTLDAKRLNFLVDDEFTQEVFFVEVVRKVSKTNVFSLNKLRFEAPVDVRKQTIEVRYDRQYPHYVIVYYQGKRLGQATLLDVHHNANQPRNGLPPTKSQDQGEPF